MVADALSWKSFSSISLSPLTLLLELRAMNVFFTPHSNGSVIANLQVSQYYLNKLKEPQKLDEKLVKLSREVQNGENLDFILTKDGVLLIKIGYVSLMMTT